MRTRTVPPLKVAGALLLAAALALTGELSHAEDRALLIGVAKYKNPSYNLPGIDLDIDIMKEVANRLGYSEQQIRVIRDEQVTVANIDHEFKTWLGSDVDAEDRVLIYYSGHGTSIPDENHDETDDAQDEVLTMYDLQPVQRNGERTLDGVLVDDHFNELLRSLPSDNVLVLIDACHSGTATKALPFSNRAFGEDVGYSKFFAYEGMPAASRSFGVTEKGSSGNFVSVAAAQDDQQAVATNKGSVFTLGVQQVVKQAQTAGEELTPRRLRDETARFITAETPPQRHFTPVLTGSQRLLDQAMVVAKASDGDGPVWRQIQDAAKRARPLTLKLNRDTYREGDHLIVNVEIPPGGGYLNLINVNAEDQATVLYPNQYDPDNRVDRGTKVVPTQRMPFDLVAQRPFGRSLIVAFVTDQPVNLFQSGNGQRNSKGEITDVFASLSTYGVRSFGVKERQSGSKVLGASAVTRVCATDC